MRLLPLPKLVILLLYFFTSRAQANAKIDSDLLQLLATGETLDVVVSFANGNHKALSRAKTFRTLNRAAKSKAIKDELMKTAEESQEDVLNLFMERSSNSFTQFWISNTLLIKEADYDLISKVAEDPQVVRIQVAPIYQIPEIHNPPVYSRQSSYFEVNDWGLVKMQVYEAWKELGDNRGEGVIVANVDTGATLHPSISHNFRGDYGWYDPIDQSPIPIDPYGHGIATMSVLAGRQVQGDQGLNLGVAPGATWMSCRGCGGQSCSLEAIEKCYQWLACPTLPDGTGEDCSKAPDILSLSLVTDRNPDPTHPALMALVEMGVIVVAGIGNSLGACYKSEYPANGEEIIGVGGIDEANVMWGGSSRGPTPDGRVKPDLVAPCYVPVATVSNENGVNWAIGTSFACPNVAGIVALLRVRDPNLTWDVALRLMVETAERNVTSSIGFDQICGNHTGPWNAVPNSVFGWGLVNAWKAVKAQTGFMAKK